MWSIKNIFLSFYMSFFTLIQQVFFDIVCVFKNFFHWSWARIIIVIFSFCLASISFLPFWWVLLIFGFFDTIAWRDVFGSFANGTQVLSLLWAFSTSPIVFFLEVCIFILWVAFAIGVYHYKSILLIRLVSSYFSENRLKLRKVVTLQYLKKYICVFPIFILYLAIPLFIFIVFFGLLSFIFGGISNMFTIVSSNPINIISISLLLLFLWSVLLFLYIYYRLIFVYPLILKDPSRSVTEVFWQSRVLTRWVTILSIFWIIFLYGIVSSPSATYENIAQNEAQELGQYYSFRALEEIPKNESFSDYGIFQYENYDEVVLDPEFIRLDTKYNSLDLNQIETKKAYSEMQSNILFIINFLIFYGVFELIIYSLYVHLSSSSEMKTSMITKARNFIKRKKEEL